MQRKPCSSHRYFGYSTKATGLNPGSWNCEATAHLAASALLLLRAKKCTRLKLSSAIGVGSLLSQD